MSERRTADVLLLKEGAIWLLGLSDGHILYLGEGPGLIDYLVEHTPMPRDEAEALVKDAPESGAMRIGWVAPKEQVPA